VVGVSPDVAWVTELSDQENASVDTGGYAQEVVVGEVADDDVAFIGQSACSQEIRSKMCRSSFLDEGGFGPGHVGEAPLEVTAADEEQAGVDSRAMQGTTVEFGHSARAAPLVGENDHANSHV
jgi:hypothetical protein